MRSQTKSRFSVRKLAQSAALIGTVGIAGPSAAVIIGDYDTTLTWGAPTTYYQENKGSAAPSFAITHKVTEIESKQGGTGAYSYTPLSDGSVYGVQGGAGLFSAGVVVGEPAGETKEGYFSASLILYDDSGVSRPWGEGSDGYIAIRTGSKSYRYGWIKAEVLPGKNLHIGEWALGDVGEVLEMGSTVAVPEPASIAIIISSTLGILGIRRIFLV